MIIKNKLHRCGHYRPGLIAVQDILLMDVGLADAFFYFVLPLASSAAVAIPKTKCPKSSQVISVVIDDYLKHPITQADKKLLSPSFEFELSLIVFK